MSLAPGRNLRHYRLAEWGEADRHVRCGKVDRRPRAAFQQPAAGSGSGEGEEDLYQLHEFGIIYHPERPFLLGITARGGDFRDLARVIRDITRLVYAEVDSQSRSETP